MLILVAPNEREMRIEVGYGVEEILPDGLAGQIVQETFLPRFRSGDYGLGIVEGTNRVAAIIRRNQPLTAEQRAALDQSASGSSSDLPIEWVLVPFFGLFVAIGFGMGGSGVGARALGPIFFGIVFGGVPWLISFLLMPGTGAQILSGVAVVASVIGILIGRQPSYRASMRGPSVWRVDSPAGCGAAVDPVGDRLGPAEDRGPRVRASAAVDRVAAARAGDGRGRRGACRP